MKRYLLIALALCAFYPSFSQEIVLPDTLQLSRLREGEEIAFKVSTSSPGQASFQLHGAEELGISFDSLGNFSWKPSYDLVDRLQQTKEWHILFEANWRDGKKLRRNATVVVHHVNRPPAVDELPVFYVKQNASNSYTVPAEFAFDPDGDPLVFKSIPSQMPEGSAFNSQGVFTWSPSKGQFASLKQNPLTIDFIVQDQPAKAERRGKIRIAQTQLDLPSEILIVPPDSSFTIREDETLNLKIYLSDPNGDDDVRSSGFLSTDARVAQNVLRENTPLQYEFIWTPGYEYVDDIVKSATTQFTFFVLDKSNNRTVRKVKVKVTDAENIQKKDTHLFQKYRSNLVDAYILIQQLDVNQKQLNQDYKKARKGKKNRSILNASLGAVTGLSPVVIDAPDESKIVSGIGGTTVLTLGTLEATEVIGRSKEAIMERIKNGIDIRNKVQAAGDEFARKYALKSSRRGADFDKDIEKLRAVLNDQRIVLLELDSYSKNPAKIDDRDIRKVFVDYTDESR